MFGVRSWCSVIAVKESRTGASEMMVGSMAPLSMYNPKGVLCGLGVA